MSRNTTFYKTCSICKHTSCSSWFTQTWVKASLTQEFFLRVMCCGRLASCSLWSLCETVNICAMLSLWCANTLSALGRSDQLLSLALVWCGYSLPLISRSERCDPAALATHTHTSHGWMFCLLEDISTDLHVCMLFWVFCDRLLVVVRCKECLRCCIFTQSVVEKVNLQQGQKVIKASFCSLIELFTLVGNCVLIWEIKRNTFLPPFLYYKCNN